MEGENFWLDKVVPTGLGIIIGTILWKVLLEDYLS